MHQAGKFTSLMPLNGVNALMKRETVGRAPPVKTTKDTLAVSCPAIILSVKTPRKKDGAAVFAIMACVRVVLPGIRDIIDQTHTVVVSIRLRR